MQLLFVMDPMHTVQPTGDTTFDLMVAAERRGHDIYWCEPAQLTLKDGKVFSHARKVSVFVDKTPHFVDRGAETLDLATLGAVWMRKDPPVDVAFYQATLLLLHAERVGARVINRPSSILTANEKLYALRFAKWLPQTLVTASLAELSAFLAQHKTIIVKPIDGNGGRGIFKIAEGDSNLSPVLETLSAGGRVAVMAQRFLPEVALGDKRIILVDGEPVGAINRVAAAGEHRSNMHVGGKAHGTELTVVEREICADLGPTLREDGLFFVGIDVIGGYLTEVNVTSPTGVQEIRRLSGIDISPMVIERLERPLT
jgi:glutathione synthase